MNENVNGNTLTEMVDREILVYKTYLLGKNCERRRVSVRLLCGRHLSGRDLLRFHCKKKSDERLLAA
jgi:hypothetical protein